MCYGVPIVANFGAPKKRRRKDYLTYGANLNGPLKTIHADGTFTIEDRIAAPQLRTLIRKGHKNR